MFVIREEYAQMLQQYADRDTDCQISLVYRARGGEYYMEVITLESGLVFSGVEKDVNQLVYRAVRQLVMNDQPA